MVQSVEGHSRSGGCSVLSTAYASDCPPHNSISCDWMAAQQAQLERQHRPQIVEEEFLNRPLTQRMQADAKSKALPDLLKYRATLQVSHQIQPSQCIPSQWKGGCDGFSKHNGQHGMHMTYMSLTRSSPASVLPGSPGGVPTSNPIGFPPVTPRPILHSNPNKEGVLRCLEKASMNVLGKQAMLCHAALLWICSATPD